MKKFKLLIIVAIMIATEIFAQKRSENFKNNPVNVNGVRVGATYIFTNNSPSGKEEQKVLDKNNIGNLITQFGWQFEKQYSSGIGNTAGITEIVVFAGGLNQGTIIPSLSGIVGFRLDNGLQFGGGPNLTVTKRLFTPGFVWITGHSTVIGKLHIPIDVVLTQSRNGVHLTLTTGFAW
jgi:hypothetical protein